MWWLYLNLFYSFFKIGLFGFGGGYAMISLIQGEVVNRHHWLTSGQFTDIVAISQMTPGPIGINSATYVGYTSVVNAGYGHAWGVLGSATATFAVVLPSFVLMLLISTWSPNFLWSSVTAGYFRSRSSGSMFSFSMRYSSSWRLSLRSSHLSMPYSL